MTFRYRVRRLMAVLSAVLAASVLLVIPGTPWSGQVTPPAQAQTVRWGSDQNVYNQCSFRRGSGSVETYSGQLCWIDMSGVIDGLVTRNVDLIKRGDPPAPLTRVTKDLGRYTLSFDIRLREWNNAEDGTSFWSRWNTDKSKLANAASNQGGVFGSTIGGVNYFTPYSGDTTKPILSFTGSNSISDYNQMNKFEFRNISLVDKATNAPVTNYRLNAIDAQSTRSTSSTRDEALSLHAPTGPGMRDYTRITPPSYVAACDPQRSRNNVYGPGVENYYAEADRGQKQFFCYESQSVTGGKGTYLVGGDGVTSLDVGLFTRNDIQAFALALNMGRMGGGVEPTDTTMERAATGQATSFDFSMATRLNGTDVAVPWQGSGAYTQVIRAMDTADGTGARAADSLVFTSAASGAEANKALARYNPEWRCTVTSTTPQTFLIRQGSVPSGFALTGDAATGTSQLVFQNPNSQPVQCRVTWVPRFEPASLTLRKSVTGTAKNFTEVQNRQFSLGYRCTVPSGYADAYPGVETTGSRSLSAGGSYTVTGLVAGSTCDLTETFPDGNPPARPGKELSLTWTGTAVSQQAASPVPTATVVLREGTNIAEGTNDVRATNNYDYRAGTVRLNKQILGEAVSSLGSPRDYRFELRCEGTDYTRTVTMAASGAGDELNGSLTFDGVPVERDCFLRPLSGLSSAEGEYINFDNREVAVNSATAPVRADGTYLIRLADYAPGSPPTAADVSVVARYSYKTRDVRVVKQLSGPAASLIDPATTFPIAYRCEVSGDASSLVEGQTTISADSTTPGIITGVRVGAQCLVYETGSPASDVAVLDRTTVSASDASDQPVTLDNTQASSTPVLQVNSSTDPRQNRVVVTNHYVNQLATVELTKAVDSVIDQSNLPSDFGINFVCGTRTVETAPNTFRSVDLSGTVRLGANRSQLLQVALDDPALSELVNDRDGFLGVPFGNTCTFSEATPTVGQGILWSSDVADQKITVDAAQESVTVTNSFRPAGNGITLSQTQSGPETMFRDIAYDLSCTAATGPSIDLGAYGTVTLSGERDTVEVPASLVFPGSECTLREQGGDPGTRGDGDGYEIERNSTANTSDSTEEFPSEAPVEVSFTVGERTVVTLSHVYDYADRTINVTKSVQFDPYTEQYISQVRKNVKYNRLFDVQLTCTPPDGGTPITLGGRVSSPQSNDLTSRELSFGNIPDGSRCVITEGETTAAEGIDFTQEVEVGDNRGERTLAFTVAGDTPVTLVNTYFRRLATVELNKIANAPINIAASYPDAPNEAVYRTHTFRMVCTDPEGTATESGALPEIAPQQIAGPGTTTFTNVPVGADCSITGDEFGQLDLKKNVDGTDLETHLRPDRVEWQLRRDDQQSQLDTDLADGKTSFDSFSVKDDLAQGGSGNVIDLTNYYQFVLSKVKMSKDIEAAPEDMQLVRKAGTQLHFHYQCAGVGYTLSDIGLPTTLEAGDTSVFPDPAYRFDSQEVEVPSGALCTFEETDPTNVPAAVTWATDQEVISERVGAENEPAKSYDFVNRAQRRMVPVRLSALQDGYLGGLPETAGYTYNVVCKDPAATTVTAAFTIGEADSTATVADGVAPGQGAMVNVPVGVECTLDLGDSTALQARPQLEVTAGTRTPFVSFGAWMDGEAFETNPETAPASLPPGDVTTDMKDYMYTFTVPETAYSEAGQPVMTIAGEAVHLRDRVDLIFKKESYGAAGEGLTFEFSSTCGPSFRLRAGEEKTLQGVDVERNCAIFETDVVSADGGETVFPVVALGEVGGRIDNAVASVQRDAETGLVSGGSWSFRVLAAAAATDTSSGGEQWSLTGINRFPGISLDKRIAGSPVSMITGAIANTAILPDDATVMRFTYTVTNNGALPVSEIKVVEPELADATVVAADGTTYTVGADGAVPAQVCTLDGELAPNGTKECSFDVVIAAGQGESFSYRGTATASAVAEGATVSASDTFGAFRLSAALGFMLPDTGAQTLVLVLVLGLLLLAVGLWRYLRTKQDEEMHDDHLHEGI